MFEIDLKGYDDLNSKLLQLEPKIAKAIVRKHLVDAARIVLACMQSQAMSVVGVKTGLGVNGKMLSEGLMVKAMKAYKKGTYARTVRIKSEKEGAPKEFAQVTKDGVRHWVPSAIEYGHTFPGDTGSGKKDVAPLPFMRKGWALSEKQALSVFMNGLQQEIAKLGKGTP